MNASFRGQTQTAKKIQPIPVIVQEPLSTIRSIPSGKEDPPASAECLPVIAGTITQRRPRNVLRLCVILTFSGFCLTTVCNTGLVVFLHPLWWLFMISWTLSLISVLASLSASRNGKVFHIQLGSFSSMLNICSAIGTLCIVMKVMEDAVAQVADPNSSPSSYTRMVASHKALLIALGAVYGIGCTVLSGTVMVYLFFLARRVQRQPPNWLFSRLPSRRQLRSQLSMPSFRSTSIV
jgi:hypothetical protein